MGQEVASAAKLKNIEVAGGVDPRVDGFEQIPCSAGFDGLPADIADCIIDFSNHASTSALLKYAVSEKLPLVIATTGHTEEEIREIKDASEKIPLFYASNYCLGIALMTDAAKRIASAMPDADIEIVEYHHNRKIDAPSGTALTVFNELKKVRLDAVANMDRHNSGKRQQNEIGISSVRMGNVCGIHEILISTQYQTITLKHEAHTRAAFAEGALVAAEYLVDMPVGLYTVKDLL